MEWTNVQLHQKDIRMSNSFDKVQSKRKQRRNSNFCSTPLINRARKLSSISVSAVDTNSSSSSKTISRNVIKKRRERKTKTESKKRKRKTKLRAKTDSDSDWETRSEQSVFGETSFQDSIKNNVLFVDAPSPERVRDAPFLVEDILEPPTLQSNRWQIESPRRISFGEEDTLPLKELPFLSVPLDDTDDDEHLILRRENTVKTYPSLQRSKKEVSIEKGIPWLVDVSISTTSSDLLWDEFVKNNYEKVKKFLAKSSGCKQKSSKYEHRKRQMEAIEDLNKDLKSNINKICDQEERNELDPFTQHVTKLRKNMNVAYGSWNKSLGKWIRKYEKRSNVYSFPEEKDANIESGSRITLNSYLRKCRAEKEKVKEKSSNLIKSKQSGLKDSKFVSRLNSNEKMIANETLDETNVPVAPSSLKRVNEQDTNDTKNTSKRQRIIANNKPRIRAVESLTTMRYEKDTNTWRIIVN